MFPLDPLSVGDSSMFGPSKEPDRYTRERLRRTVESSPLAVFQALNKALNERGMSLHIATLPTEALQ